MQFGGGPPPGAIDPERVASIVPVERMLAVRYPDPWPVTGSSRRRRGYWYRGARGLWRLGSVPSRHPCGDGRRALFASPTSTIDPENPIRVHSRGILPAVIAWPDPACRTCGAPWGAGDKNSRHSRRLSGSVSGDAWPQLRTKPDKSLAFRGVKRHVTPVRNNRGQRRNQRSEITWPRKSCSNSPGS